jgi:hypothetical protein
MSRQWCSKDAAELSQFSGELGACRSLQEDADCMPVFRTAGPASQEVLDALAIVLQVARHTL